MTDLKLDDNHDLLIRDGRLVLVEGANQTAQQIKIALLTFFGEWFMDTSIGLPYLSDVLIKNSAQTKLESIIRFEILKVKNVAKIKSLKLVINRKERILNIQFEVQTSRGSIKDEIGVKQWENMA